MISHGLAVSHQRDTKPYKFATESQWWPSDSLHCCYFSFTKRPTVFLQATSLWCSEHPPQPQKAPQVPCDPHDVTWLGAGRNHYHCAASHRGISLHEEEPLLPLLWYSNQVEERNWLKANLEDWSEKSALRAVLSALEPYICYYLGVFFSPYPWSSIFNWKLCPKFLWYSWCQNLALC